MAKYCCDFFQLTRNRDRLITKYYYVVVFKLNFAIPLKKFPPLRCATRNVVLDS